MRISKNGYTPKQKAYAIRTLGGAGQSKKEIALASGYSPSMAENAKPSIEDSVGFNNAMADLAHETGNVVLEAYSVIKSRLKTDPDKITYDQLLATTTVLSQAFERFTPKKSKEDDSDKGNPLKGLFTVQPVKTINATATDTTTVEQPTEVNPF